MERKFRLQKTGAKLYLLDVRGQVCPYPQLLMMRAVNALSHGDILEVLLDNPPSVRDIPLAMRDRGYEVEEPASVGKGIWKVTVRL